MRTFLTSFIVLIFFLPLSIQVLIPQWKVDVGGVTRERKLPTFSLEKFLDGRYQKRFEKWFISKLGVRGALIKTDNQLNVSVFRQLSSSKKAKAILGHEGHLIERAYIDRAFGIAKPKRKALLTLIDEVALLRDVLAERGSQLFILISPSKAARYSELIPRSFAPLLAPEDNGYEPLPFIIKQLQQHKVPFVNTVKIFDDYTEKSNQRLFAHTGTHWSELGSCLALSALAREIQKQDPSFRGSISCDVTDFRPIPLTIDRDLLSVANVWFPEWFVRPGPKVVRNVQSPPMEMRQSALFVGTSFLWALFHHLDKSAFFGERDMYYYFKKSHPYPRGKVEVIKRSEGKWYRRALRHKYIILEVNESFLHRLGHGFPKRMLRFLKQDRS